MSVPELRIISGGQTGADLGAIRAARSRGVPTGGLCPLGWRTEAGPAPWLAEYGLHQALGTDYRGRTRLNVLRADALLWFGNPHSPGGRLTLKCAREAGIDIYTVAINGTVETSPGDVANWLRDNVFLRREHVTLMVAGNRESGSPGIGARVEAFLGEVLDLLPKGD